ncbi:50S ribosomal protein L23 [Candidatus Uhrbacteria bacterium]|nr:50S ribosomal protein L23 [Candidatus Uhrbacteria bacterium]
MPPRTPRPSKKSAAAPAPATDRPRRAVGVLLAPHLTEKSSVLAERGQYTFLVSRDAEKVTIARAVAERYGVHPVRVAIVHLPGKVVRSGKTSGVRSSIRKAIVTLRAGEKIPFGVKS